MTGSIVGHAVNYINPTFNPDKEPAEFQAGRMVGSAAALYQGIAELIGGAGEIVGGGAATIISPAAGPGAPAVAVGGIAVSGAGVALAGVGIAHTGFGISSLYNSSRVFFAKGKGFGNIGKPASKTFGRSVEAKIGGKKVQLRVDAEPHSNKIQIQSGRGKNSVVDHRIDPEKPLEPQIPKNWNLSKGQKQELLRNIEQAKKWLKS